MSLIRKIMLLFVMVVMITGIANAVSCPVIAGVGNWNVSSNCTMPPGIYTIWGDLGVGNKTINIPNNSAVVMNFNTKKITFSSGKILFNGNAAIYGKADGYSWYVSGAGNHMTACPAGKKAYNPYARALVVSSNSSNHPAGSVIPASTSGWIICK